MLFTIKLDNLYVEKPVSQMFFLTITRKSSLILMILYLNRKNVDFANAVLLLIKSVLNKVQSHYYYNIFLEK